LKQKTTQYHKLLAAAKWLLRQLDSLLTFPDVVFFVWYGLMRNGVREKKKMDIKRRKNIKAKMPDLNSLFKTATKELDFHNEEMPFVLRFVPTIVLSAIVWITVIIAV